MARGHCHLAAICALHEPSTCPLRKSQVPREETEAEATGCSGQEGTAAGGKKELLGEPPTAAVNSPAPLAPPLGREGPWLMDRWMDGTVLYSNRSLLTVSSHTPGGRTIWRMCYESLRAAAGSKCHISIRAMPKCYVRYINKAFFNGLGMGVGCREGQQ